MTTISELASLIFNLFETRLWILPTILFLLSWGTMLFFGRPLILWLKGLKGMKWSPREDTPDSHISKTGTPSMGGIGIVSIALVCYFTTVGPLSLLAYFMNWGLSSEISRSLARLLIFPFVVGLHAVLGFVDDWSKATGRGGLRSRTKLAGQVAITCGFLIAYVWLDMSYISSSYLIQENLSLATIATGLVLFALVVVGTSNAVNLTDGIDGLAAGLCVQCGLALILVGGSQYSVFENIVGPSGGILGPVSFLWAALAGSCLGFLAYNKYKAQVFMGDTGSLALGAALGAGAILTGTIALLPFIGFIFFVEMFSVIFQVAWFKFTRKKYGEGQRLLRRAPLHHHFELVGWSEWRVVGTFWAINALTSAIGLVLWKLEILPRFPQMWVG